MEDTNETLDKYILHESSQMTLFRILVIATIRVIQSEMCYKVMCIAYKQTREANYINIIFKQDKIHQIYIDTKKIQ